MYTPRKTSPHSGPIRRAFLVALTFMAFLLVAVVPAASYAMPLAANDWRIGNDVGLSKGTQIRRGPGTGFCYHTVVPEDNWTVRIINGPQQDTQGNIWWDASRSAAGDPGGGTGWVRQQQADASPAPDDGGQACPDSQASRLNLPFKIEVPLFLLNIEIWWAEQVLPVKLGVLAGALVLLVLAMRWSDTDNKAGGVNNAILGFAKAILIGILLGGVADLTRNVWESSWFSFAGGDTGIDPALLLLVLPVAWFLVSLVLGAVGKVLAIVFALIQLVLMLLYLFPDRASSILTSIGNLIGGPK